MWFSRHKRQFLLAAILLLGAFLRFHKLDWGDNHFFHPDEYHIVGAVERLVFPDQMDPDHFSYGSLTIYLIFFTKLLVKTFTNPPLILNSFLVGRFYSALFSTLTILVVYRLSTNIFKKNLYALIAAFLVATGPGLIQQAHFTTPESFLIFWLFFCLFWGVKWQETKKTYQLYLAAICLGLALGTKIVALTFLPILLLIPLTAAPLEKLKNPPSIFKNLAGWRFWWRGIKKLIKLLVVPTLLVGLFFSLAFPYALIRWESFRHSINYETGVGRGEPVVFYTRQFIDTTPLLFQLEKILPYALGPGVLILGILGLMVLAKDSLKNRRLLIVLLAFLAYFLPNALLFAKWTRFIAPAFPFFAVFTAYLLEKLRTGTGRYFLIPPYLLIAINLVWSGMFFGIYLRPDVRSTATDWAIKNLSANSYVLTETGNTNEVPLTGDFVKKAFEFYHLDKEAELQQDLPGQLEKADYFIIQSRRLFTNHQRLPDQFPITNRFYSLLLSNQLGFEKVIEFDSFPKIVFGQWQLAVPDETAEETWSVFDHPVVQIYQKTIPYSAADYQRFLQMP